MQQRPRSTTLNYYRDRVFKQATIRYLLGDHLEELSKIGNIPQLRVG
ncbi:hypothetical protein GEOBRER4_n2289 [Citrifermentans bremense]|uniref:Uncharacterized protein n=1 Tax=Citrifermentans bremense TaxID=60035 RepID=A0A7R7FTI4_9BACT|nr:hypothetical protein GEOBRER4_n2289 [Citrifermentans bremense]